MTTADLTVTLTSDVNKIWRYVQSPLGQGFNFMCDEVKWLNEIKKEGLNWSARSTLLMLDLNEGGRIASIPEGGWKARPHTPNVEEGTITLQHFDGRFDLTELARWADKGQSNQLEQQLKYSGKKVVQAMGRHVADYFHGSASAVLALTDTDISGTTAVLTLHSAYGNTGITNAAYIANKFRVNDYIALFDSSTLVTNGIGIITAVTAATPSISVTFIGSVTATNNNLKVVKANSMENTTEAGTDYLRGLVGFQDALTAAALHGLTHGNWSVAYSDTSGNRLNGVRLRAAFDAMEDDAPEQYKKADKIMIDKAVYRDMIAYERPALHFTDSFNMETDGDVKSGDRVWQKSKRVPPGYAIPYNSKSISKIQLIGNPDEQGGLSYEDGQLRLDQSVITFDMPWVGGLVWHARKALSYFTGLTRQT